MPSPVRTPDLRRRRQFAIAATAALFGPLLLAGGVAGPASAADVAEPVTFTGGCGLLGIGAKSAPDVDRVSVLPGATLRFANELGQPGTLLVAGEPASEVPASGFVRITFHTGVVAVSMRLSCLEDSQLGEVVVTVESAPGAGPAPAPPTSPPAGPPPAGSGGGDAAPPGEPGGAPVPGGGPELGGSGNAGASDQGSAGNNWPAGGEPPPAAGGSGQAPADGPMSRYGSADDLSAGGGSVEDSLGGAGPGGPVTVNPPSAGDSTDLAPAAGSGADDAAIGLLALVATVCLVGASAGAVRVLLTQRSKRTKLGVI